jgi:hypothetical protein
MAEPSTDRQSMSPPLPILDWRLSMNFVGGMSEWFKEAVLKTAVRETVPGVRIPLPPPITCYPPATYELALVLLLWPIPSPRSRNCKRIANVEVSHARRDHFEPKDMSLQNPCRVGPIPRRLAFSSAADRSPGDHPSARRRRFAKAAGHHRTGLKSTISGPFFLGTLVGIGCRMMVVGPVWAQ